MTTRPVWLDDPDILCLINLLGRDAHEVRFIGGCVRDHLMGRPFKDFDLATCHPPDEVIRRLEAARIKYIPTGIDHGTITAVINERPFEITSLRRDVETDGRHAAVAFGTDWQEDALRRDFTMNALSMDAQGKVHDYVNGLEDLKAERVRFIGDPLARIREDYLRILRFYRFSAFYAKRRPDPQALEACQSLKDGLKSLSGERIAQEFLKLLSCETPYKWVQNMASLGVLQTFLPCPADLGGLSALQHIDPHKDALLRLASLCPKGEMEAVQDLCLRLKLSNQVQKRLLQARHPAPDIHPGLTEGALRGYLYRLGPETVRDRLLLYFAEVRFENFSLQEKQAMDIIDHWQGAPAVFPLKGRDLLERGYKPGPKLGKTLKTLEDWWVRDGCTADQKACLDRLKPGQSDA